ncbi:MAG: STAS domain-containing protein [Planctomycetota bacterium]|nr:STAS domain-containing protein [Planctomycetota bacterium]
MAQLKISVVEKSENDKSLVVLALTGELDPKPVDKLKRRLDKISELGFKNLILDMEHTSYVNSSALAVLVKFAHAFKAEGGGIAMTNVNARVKLPFEMLGLLVFFQFFESLDEAKAALLDS